MPDPRFALSFRVWVGEPPYQRQGASQERSILGCTGRHEVKYLSEISLKLFIFIIPIYNLLYYMATFRIKRLNVKSLICVCQISRLSSIILPILGPMSFSTWLTLLDDIYINTDEIARILIHVNILHIHVNRNSIHIYSYICLPHHKIKVMFIVLTPKSIHRNTNICW